LRSGLDERLILRPRKYPDEFCLRAAALDRAGQSVTKTASDLGITSTCLYGLVRQDRIDRGEIRGTTTAESRELRKARRRIRELETEVETLRRANAMLDDGARRPKGSTR
jgi:transposase-like protein